MLDFSIAGPFIGVFAITDVLLHLYLDLKKSKDVQGALFREPSVEVPALTMVAAALATLLAFFLVLCIPMVWIIGVQGIFLSLLISLLVDVPLILWSTGMVILLVGILIHGWARYERQEMAAAWRMRDDHRLVTTGPYSRVRHPSYASYFLCFIGLFMMMPSVVTGILSVGIWGYHSVAVNEEKNLLQHFGGAYKEYMKRTGRFFPKIT